MNILELAHLNNFSRVLAVGLVPLAPGPGVIKAEEYCHLGWKGQREELWLRIG